jgi:hypothetical protein
MARKAKTVADVEAELKQVSAEAHSFARDDLAPLFAEHGLCAEAESLRTTTDLAELRDLTVRLDNCIALPVEVRLALMDLRWAIDWRNDALIKSARAALGAMKGAQ